jgi:alpha-beta hydrolase superfamily lysophospholipase
MIKKVFFEKIKGKEVFCYLAEPKTSNKKIIIMSHGFRGSSIGPARTFVDFERKLLQKGYSVFRFDQPSSGNSEGDYLQSSFKEWVETIIFLAKKFLNQNYRVCLMGQSMGATATLIAANSKELKNKIPVVILWVPDPKSKVRVDSKKIYEEGGQKYYGKFWVEVKEMNFLDNLKEYQGKVHLVYGEFDLYVDKRDRKKVIEIIKKRKDEYMILKGQNHSLWRFDIAQKVYEKEIEFLRKYF